MRGGDEGRKDIAADRRPIRANTGSGGVVDAQATDKWALKVLEGVGVCLQSGGRNVRRTSRCGDPLPFSNADRIVRNSKLGKHLANFGFRTQVVDTDPDLVSSFIDSDRRNRVGPLGAG